MANCSPINASVVVAGGDNASSSSNFTPDQIYFPIIDTGYDNTTGDPFNVSIMPDNGYVNGTCSSLNNTTNADAQVMEVSGDVYAGGEPADGATLLIYVNDSLYGPVIAHGTSGPMFSVDIPGCSPGDQITITASKGDYTGFTDQCTTGYQVFLTVNMTRSDMNFPDPGMTMIHTSESPAGENPGVLVISGITIN
jgi:hypothetical protein